MGGATCTHPIRDGRGYADNFAIVGTYATDAWGRCKTCGAWWWCVLDDGKLPFEAERTIPTDLAEAALLHHDPHAIAQLFASCDLPHGPVWELASARLEIYRVLTPGVTDADRAAAIRAAHPDDRWQQVARTLEQDAAPRALDRPLAFVVDLRVDGVELRAWYEVGDALVLLTPRAELFRLDRAGLVHLPLATAPQLLAHGEDRLALAVADAVVILDAAGNATSWPLASAVDVRALDGGWWLFVPRTDDSDRWIELHAPDGQPRVKFRRRFARGATAMPLPRRFAGGWIISDLIDDAGLPQALTLFDADFAMVAQSAGVAGERHVTPIDDASFWASADGALERWVRRGHALERDQQLARGASWVVGDLLVTDAPGGEVTARGPDGGLWWTWSRTPTGATYGVAAPPGVLLYDDTRAHLLDGSGAVRAAFAVESADVSANAAGTVYLKTGAELWIVADGAARAIVVGTDARLETTCGDDALLRRDDGTCTLVGRTGIRGTFEARDAVFSVSGTRGLWVVEGDRIRAIPPTPGA